MSEQGWQEFLAAEGLEDWVVLHGGATAVYRLPSMAEAAQLAAAVAQVPGIDGALMTVADGQLTVRLTREVMRLERRHVDLARAVSALAREHRAPADRSKAQEVQVAIAARPDVMSVGFWRAVLGYAELAEDNAIDPLGHGSTVWMQDLDPAKPLRHAMHVDVSVARDRSIGAWPRHSRRVGASLPSQTPRPPGSWPIRPATRSAFARGPMAPVNRVSSRQAQQLARLVLR